MKALLLDGKLMSRFDEHQTFWGIPNLYRENVSRLFVITNSKEKSLFTKWTTPPVVTFLEYGIKLNKAPLNRAATLRIPASTWKKMDNKFDEIKKQQSKKVYEILGVNNGQFHTRCFSAPLNSKVVSLFASPRTLPSGKRYYHTGVDLRARTGTPILSTANGIVVMTEDMIVPGKTVIVDHGGGVYSRYLHLDEFLVQPGDYVKRGQILAYSGGTGRVEAPHLHWEIIWKKRKANPHRFIASMNRHCKSPQAL